MEIKEIIKILITLMKEANNKYWTELDKKTEKSLKLTKKIEITENIRLPEVKAMPYPLESRRPPI